MKIPQHSFPYRLEGKREMLVMQASIGETTYRGIFLSKQGPMECSAQMEVLAYHRPRDSTFMVAGRIHVCMCVYKDLYNR